MRAAIRSEKVDSADVGMSRSKACTDSRTVAISADGSPLLLASSVSVRAGRCASGK